MAQLQIFENFAGRNFFTRNTVPQGTFMFQGFELAHSISFNNPIVAIQASVTDAASTSGAMSFSLGLYSRNGNTLSLANSASFSASFTTNVISWYTMATSATQNLTPGNWYWGWLFNQDALGNSRISFFNGNSGNSGLLRSAHGGGFVRGFATNPVTTALLTSIATSNLTKEGVTAGGSNRWPYIVLSA